MKQGKWGRRIASMLAALILLGGAACVTSAGDPSRIVVFRDGTPLQAQQDLVTRSGSRVRNILSLITALAIELPSAPAAGDSLTLQVDPVARALQILQADPSVVGVYADPTMSATDGAGGDLVISVYPADSPAREYYPWGLTRIGVPTVHAGWSGLDGSGVKVAILDTGIDRQHPELQQNIIGGINARAGESQGDFQDYNGHGTHVAGIIAARANQLGVVGAAPHALIYAIKVLDQNGAGKVSDLISGLGFVRVNQINVANMSLGFPQEWGPYPPLETAIKRLYDAGIIMVAAAGNTNPRSVSTAQGAGGDGAGGDTTCTSGTAQGAGGDGAGGDTTCTCGTAQGAGGDGAGGDTSTYCYKTTMVKVPAAYPWVIAVGATNDQDQVAEYSRSGSEMTTHGVVAPGGSQSTQWILSSNKEGAYGWAIGTSQATAHVTGTIALALQLQRDLSFANLLDLFKRTGRLVPGFPSDWQGVGLIDAERLVETLKPQ